MEVREHVSLKELTTLKVGGDAPLVLTLDAPGDIEAALTLVRERGLSFVVLGEGSNVLPRDEGYPGAVLLMRIPGITFTKESEDTLVEVGAGVSWDALVSTAATEGLWGMENLAGIPGTVGAAPVQNIGAYGMELEQTLERVDAYDTRTATSVSFDRTACAFGYRDSRFKHEPWLVITSVTFRLTHMGSPRIGYADLRTAKEQGEDLTTPEAIGVCVRQIRARKFPDLAVFGTAGSFFKNPVISPETFATLTERYGALPSFPMGSQVKIPLAYILDKILGLRGYRHEHAFLFGNQPLVLVAERGATAQEVDALARDIEKKVLSATGISIEREVRMIAAHEWH